MILREEALERLEQNKRTLRHYLKSQHINYMAYLGSIIDCELLANQHEKENNKPLVLKYIQMKDFLVREFENYCLKNGHKYK